MSRAAALCGARDAMKSPVACCASSAAHPVVVVAAGLVAARVSSRGVDLVLRPDRTCYLIGSAGVVELGKLACGKTGRCKRSPLEMDGRALTFDIAR